MHGGSSSRTFRLDVGYACTTEHHREVSSLAWRPDPAGGRWPLTLPVVLFLRHRRATRGCRPVVYPGRVRRRTMVETDFPAEARGPARRRSAHLHATQRASQSNPVVRASSAESLSKHSSPPRPRLASRIRARNVREERNANGVARTTREGKPPCRAVASRRRSPGTSTGARMMCVLSPIASQPRARALASLANLRAAHPPPGPRTSASRPRRPAFARRTAGEVDPRRSSPCAPRAPPPRRARRPAALRAASR